jgi:hypothetical protein
MDPLWDDIRKKAQQQTENEYASQISSLTRLTDAQIKEIAPDPASKEKLAALLGIICDASKTNTQKVDALKAVDQWAEVVVPLLLKLL